MRLHSNLIFRQFVQYSLQIFLVHRQIHYQ